MSENFVVEIISPDKSILKAKMPALGYHDYSHSTVRQFGFEKLDNEPLDLKFCPPNLVI